MATHDADVIVVGAGLAGLATAIRLQAAGKHVAVFEAASGVGGRVATDHVDGFTLDRGFQLLNPAYPAVRRLVDMTTLGPRRFWRAVRIVDGEHTHLLGHPLDTVSTIPGLLRSGHLGMGDKIALAALSARAIAAPARLLTEAPDHTTAAELRRWSVSGRAIAEVFTPFLSGVFAEADLQTSSRYFHLVWRSFLRAAPVLPAAGMGAVAEQLASRLAPGTVRLDQRVDDVAEGSIRVDGSTYRARVVVVATEADTAVQWLPELSVPEFKSLRTLYFRSPRAPVDDPVLTIDARSDGPVRNTAVVSNVAPTYAPPGAALIEATTLGDGCEREVRAQLARLYRTSTRSWELIADYRIPRALPSMAAPHILRQSVRVREGLYVCGDHRDTSSIQGSLASGMRTATAICQHELATSRP